MSVEVIASSTDFATHSHDTVNTEEIRRPESYSGLFSPYKVLGCYSSEVKLDVKPLGEIKHMIACPIGDCFQLVDGENLRVAFSSSRISEDIISLVMQDEYVYASTEDHIYTFYRGKVISGIDTKNQERAYTAQVLTLVGDVLFAQCSDNIVRIYKIPISLYRVIEVENFTISALVHPSTYVNKIVLGSNEGLVQIWNMRKMQLIYTLNERLDSGITVMVQSPALDIIAIGTLSGIIALHNIKTDTRVLTFSQGSRVMCISFNSGEKNLMATAGASGSIWIWDLDGKRLLYTLRDAHHNEIHTLYFYESQPIFISSGNDNSIKQWIFDNLDERPRILRQRLGHQMHPTKVRFYGEDNFSIISSSSDRTIRCTSLLKASRSFEFSQGSIEKMSKRLSQPHELLRLPPIVDFDSSGQKHNYWDDVITCHLNDNVARTWSFRNKVIGKNALESLDGSPVTSVSLSSCGNFAFVGSENGSVYKYNLQSGQHRLTYGPEDSTAHLKRITGMVSDGANRVLVTSSLDKTIKIWRLNDGRLLKTFDFEFQITQLCLNRSNNFVAAVFSDFTIKILDVESYQIVRIFKGHKNKVLDMTFSPDSSFLVTCSMDSTIRTWDVSSGNNVDILKCAYIPLSVAYSPTGAFLSSAHAGRNGIYIWSNTIFYKIVSLKKSYDEDDMRAGRFELSEPTKDVTFPSATNDMIMFSSLPQSRSNALINIDTIKQRNKPIEPPKKLEPAPFYLGSSTSLGMDYSPKNSLETKDVIPKCNPAKELPEFIRILRSAHESGEYSGFIKYMDSLSPSNIAAEFEFMSLECNLSDAIAFLKAMSSALRSKNGINIVEAYINAFLKSNYHYISNEQLLPALEELLEIHESTWETIKYLYQYIFSMVDFIRY